MARLRRSNTSGPGIVRLRHGSGFRYVAATDSGEISAEDRLRIDNLVIPPAWDDVWISADERGHIQALGTDAAGRRQYLYHEQWRAQKDRLKYQRSLELAAALPRARRGIPSALRGSEPTRERALAAAFRLLDQAAPRVGGERYTELHGSHGLATLLTEHVHISSSQAISLSFPGKSGQEWSAEFVDAELARTLRSFKRRGPQNVLLCWRDGDEWRPLQTDEINSFLHERLGGEFTAKDFRTLRGGAVAAQALAVEGVLPSQTARTKAVTRAVRVTADALGNTPSVARTSYIDPRIIDLYHSGVLAERARGNSAEKALRVLLGHL